MTTRMVDITPEHLRCSIGGCASVHVMDDGRVLIVGDRGDQVAYDHGIGVAPHEQAVIVSMDILCQANVTAAGERSSPDGSSSSRCAEAISTATGQIFRDTPGGSLEIMQDGVWTSIPHAAQMAIRTMHGALEFMSSAANAHRQFEEAQSADERDQRVVTNG